MFRVEMLASRLVRHALTSNRIASEQTYNRRVSALAE